LTPARLVQRTGATRSCGIHLELQCSATPRAEENRYAADRSARIHRTRSRRPQPLEHTSLRRVAAAQGKTSLRSAVRPLLRRPLPPRDKIPALASGEEAAAVHVRASDAEQKPDSNSRRINAASSG